MSIRRNWLLAIGVIAGTASLLLAPNAIVAQEPGNEPAVEPQPEQPDAPEDSAATESENNEDNPSVPMQDDEQLQGLVGDGEGESSEETIPDGDEMVNLNLQSQKVDEIIQYIVQWTGKVVMVQESALLSKKITVMSEKPVPRRKAIELLFQAFKLNDLAVVETDEMIMIDSINDVVTLQPGIVLGPEVDIEQFNEDGNIVIKVFQIREARATDIFDRLEGSRPEYVEMSVDANSNQIIVEGDIGYAKRLARLIKILDVEPYIAVKVETFRLKYADANTVAGLIETLFAPSGVARATTTQRSSSNQQQARGRPTTPSRNTNQPVIEVGTSEQLTVTVLEPTNSITVRAEPDILNEISTLLNSAWDVPPSREGDIFRIFDLKHTDPIKVKELLSALLESGGSGSSGSARGNQRTSASGGGSGADAAVANIFRIEAYPDSNRLIVISKSPSNFEWLAEMIDKIDQPLSVGMPVNVELKHASAIDVAEILNALLASAGGGTSISAPEEGLSGVDFNVASGDGTTNTAGGSGSAEREISFPWQNARGSGEDATEVSALVGKARVVPNSAQNSLLVLATPEIQQAVLDIIQDLDRPGRQVMITAVLAEVELGDEFEFGLRFGQGISPENPDNAVVVSGNAAGGSMFQAELSPAFPGTFQTSILNFGVDATVILQALDQVTNARILQQPRIFTSDNKEAKFFDGQDVPFQSSAESGTGGNEVISSYEQIAVGIGVNVRPRITKEKNVAMEIEILLSNITSQAGGVGNNPIINRRQTNTSVTVKNGQTIVLSGIRKEEEEMVQRKVPFLGDIPILDLIFSSELEQAKVSELVVFITPIVVDNPDENDVNFNELDRRRLERLNDPINERARQLQKTLSSDGESSSPTVDPRRD